MTTQQTIKLMLITVTGFIAQIVTSHTVRTITGDEWLSGSLSMAVGIFVMTYLLSHYYDES